MRIKKNDYVLDWEENRADEIKALTGKGIIPAVQEQQANLKSKKELSFKETMDRVPLLMGQAAGAITEVLPAKQIMEEMVDTCIAIFRRETGKVTVVADSATASASL